MIGERIFILRCQKGFTQAELAKMLYISTSALGMYEKGRRKPSLDMVVQVAHIFGVSVDYLLLGKRVTQKDIDVCAQALRYLCAKFKTDVCTLFTDEVQPQEIASLATVLSPDQCADLR